MAIPKWMVKSIAKKWLPSHLQAAIDRAAPELNSAGFDRWGLDPTYLKACMAIVWPMYKSYFRVRVHGLNHIGTGKIMLVANHSGQVPLDAILITLALLDRAPNPRVVRAMVEHWVPTIPFVSDIFSRCGQIVGEPRNCLDLLRKKQCLLVFPEGMRGISKPYSQRYALQKFGTGFVRLASEARAPIVPTAVVGCEETYPTVAHWKGLSKLVNAPHLPFTPTFPWLGPLGAIPLPAPVDIYFGRPIKWPGKGLPSEDDIVSRVEDVQSSLEDLLAFGLKQRTGAFFHRRIGG